MLVQSLDDLIQFILSQKSSLNFNINKLLKDGQYQKDENAFKEHPHQILENGTYIGGLKVEYKATENQPWTTCMKYFLANLQWLIYATQLKDIADQFENLKQHGNYNIGE